MSDTPVARSAGMRSYVRGFQSAAAAFAFGIGAVALVGWLLGIRALTTLGTGVIDVKANAAAGLCLAAFASWLAQRTRAPRWRSAAAASGGMLSLIGVLTLAEYLFGTDFAIDELLVADTSTTGATSHPGRMGPNTAVCLTLLGTAIVLLSVVRRAAARRVADALLVGAAAVAFVALVGYAVGLPGFYRLSSWTQMAPATAAAIVGIAVATLRLDFLGVRLLRSGGPAGRATRTLLPAGIVLPVALAWLSRRGERAGLYGDEVGDLLVVGSLVAVLVSLVLTLAAGIDRMTRRREAAEEGRRAAEARYRMLIEQLPLVTYVDKPDATATSIYISPQVTELLGYTPEDWRSDTELFPKILHPDDRDRVLASQESAYRETDRWSLRYRVIARDGRTVWLRDDALVMRDGAGEAESIQGFLIDITPQKEAEESLTARSDALTALHETAMGVLKGLNLDALLETILSRAGTLARTEHAYLYLADGDELEVRLATGMFRENVGYRLRAGEGVAGRVYESGTPLVVDDYHAWSERRADFDRFRLHGVIGVPLRSGSEVVGVLGLAHVDKTHGFTTEEAALLERFAALVSLALENARLYAAAQDELAERRRTEEALREAEAKYRELVENVPLVIYLDTPDEQNSAIYVSPQIEPILGFSSDEWLTDPAFFTKILHPADRERVMHEIERAHETNTPFSSEYRLIARDGREVWFRDEARHIRDEDGLPVFAQGFMLDITDQKRVEEALRESEERFRSLVSNVPGAIFRCTFDERWRVEFISGVIEEISGYAPEEFLRPNGRTLGSIVHRDDIARVLELLEAAERDRDAYEVEYRIVRSDGEIRSFVERGQFSAGDDGSLLRDGAIFDITKRRRAEDALQASERQLAHAQAVAHVGSWHWDVAADTVAWSDELYRIHGVERGEGEMSYATIRELVHPDDAGRLEKAVEAAYEGSETFAVDYRIVRPDGAVRRIHARGEVVEGDAGQKKMLGTAQDVTERRDAEEKLRQAELRYRTLVEHLPLGTYIRPLDLSRGNLYASPQVEELLGYSVDDWKGDPDLLGRIVHPDDRARVLAEAARVRETGESFRGEYRYVARDGRTVWVQDETYVVHDHEGEPYCVQGYLLDITDQKRASAEREHLLQEAQEARSALAAQNARLLELDRLKDEFIALVSHELRTPLTSIRGYLELVLDNELSDEHRKFLEVVDRNSNRLLRLVTDLLFLAEIEAGQLALDVQPLDVSDLVAETIEAARPSAEGKEITLSASGQMIPPLYADGARMAQVLDNLVSNAVKFTPSGGRVEIRTRIDGTSATVAIEDSGMGIPAEEQPHVFDRFFRTSSATQQAIQGTGLGLSISKAIVEAHGGDITVASEETGTTFTVRLPLPSAAPPR